MKISKAVWANPHAKQLLESAEMIEEPIYWTDKETGAPCKARIDAYTHKVGKKEVNCLIDLKTCRNAKYNAFQSDLAKWEYPCQMAHYKDAIESLRHKVERVVLIAVEAAPPYGVMCYPLSLSDISIATITVKEYLKQYKYCMDNDHWPCYPAEFENISPPEWWYKKH
jgi:hypothetical protein